MIGLPRVASRTKPRFPDRTLFGSRVGGDSGYEPSVGSGLLGVGGCLCSQGQHRCHQAGGRHGDEGTDGTTAHAAPPRMTSVMASVISPGSPLATMRPPVITAA